MKKKHCFISGAITGVDDYLEKFKRAEEQVVTLGMIPVNPAACTQPLMEANCQFEYPQWLLITMTILKQCDCIFMLKDWEFSKGAKKEYAQAKKLGMKIYYQENVK